MKEKNLPIFILILLFFVGCAGPLGPFKGQNPSVLLSEATTNNELSYRGPSSDVGADDNAATGSGKTFIRFSPQRKYWHKKTDLEITVQSQEKIEETHLLKIFYGHRDVSEELAGWAKKSISKNKKVLTVTIPSFRLLPRDDKDFQVAFQNKPTDQIQLVTYEEPVCRIYETDSLESNFHQRRKIKRTLRLVENISLNKQINPSLLAGLVRQESSFNPYAVSWAKAIGLTQITSLAEEEIIDKFKAWPRYPNIEKLSYPKLKTLILLGKINADNEWRLDDEKNLIGGIEYLKFLDEFWHNKENYKKHLGSVENDIDIILASYNSGAARVRRAISSLGDNWLDSSKLREAKNYVRKVKSYCYEFSGNRI